MSADAAHGGMAAFIPKSRKPELYARLYALGYSQVDVYEMSAATVLDIVARGESKAEPQRGSKAKPRPPGRPKL